VVPADSCESCTMSLFGLKITRLWQWERAVQDELGRLGWREKLDLFLEMGKVAVRATVGQRSYAERRSRFRKKIRRCMKCPIYDRVSRRCRPYWGSPLGCGCYVPYLAILKDQCWGDIHFSEEEDVGWKLEQRSSGDLKG